MALEIYEATPLKIKKFSIDNVLLIRKMVKWTKYLGNKK